MDRPTVANLPALSASPFCRCRRVQSRSEARTAVAFGILVALGLVAASLTGTVAWHRGAAYGVATATAELMPVIESLAAMQCGPDHAEPPARLTYR